MSLKKLLAGVAVIGAAFALAAVRAEETALPEFDAATITGDELVALCAKIDRPLTEPEVDSLRERLAGRRMAFTFSGWQARDLGNGNGVLVDFPDAGRGNRKAYMRCRFDFQVPSTKQWDWDEHDLVVRGTLVVETEDKKKTRGLMRLSFGPTMTLFFKNAVLDRSKASRECFIPEFCGVRFGTPTLTSTNGLTCSKEGGGSIQHGDDSSVVEYRCQSWWGVAENVRPAAFFDKTVVSYTFKTLTPYSANFFGHFPKGATRAECLAAFDSFVAEVNEKYPVNLQSNAQFRNAVEPEGFVPCDPPTNLTNWVDRYRPCRKFGECFGRYEGETNGCDVWVWLSESAFGERVVSMTVLGYHKKEIYRSEKLDIDEIEGLLSFESKKAKTESDEARRVREDERERFKLRYGFLADVLFVSEDVKAGTALTKDKLQCRDYVGMGVSDRCLQAGDLKSVLGRKVAFDLKRGSILLKTDLCEEAAQK